MTRLKVHQGHITLPDHLLHVLGAGGEGEIDAEVVEHGVLLKGADVDRDLVERIRRFPEQVKYIGPQPRPSAEVEEQEIADLIKQDRVERRRTDLPQ